MQARSWVLAFVFLWFLIGGIGHFIAPEFFLRIVPPNLPLRREAVYVSGFFEVVGALALLSPQYRRMAGWGLIALTLSVTPANVYMWTHSHLFPAIPPFLLAWRLGLQILLLIAIWWSTNSAERRN